MLFIDPMIQLHWLQLMVSAAGWEDKNGIWFHAMFGWNAFVRSMVGPDHHLLRSGLSVGLTLVTACGQAVLRSSNGVTQSCSRCSSSQASS